MPNAPTFAETGWSQIDDTTQNSSDYTKPTDIDLAFARCFKTKDGQRVLEHLKRITIERVLSPSDDSRVLRHMEGQRYIVMKIDSLSKSG